MATKHRKHRPSRSLTAVRPWLLLATLLLAGCAAGAPPSPPSIAAGQGDIVVELSGFRSDRGLVLVGLFASADGFPVDASKALSNLETSIADDPATVTFTQVPWGRYAVGVLHDENGNGQMDTGLLGIPEEGHAASNNVDRRFGAPSFEEAVFVFDRERLVLPITLRYVERRQGPFGR